MTNEETAGTTTSSTIVTSGSPRENVFSEVPRDIRKQEVKVAIQRQYFRSAEQGKISFIRAWRILRGLDQAELAAKAGMTQPEISRAERPGQARKMKGETLLRIARSLSVKIEDLLG